MLIVVLTQLSIFGHCAYPVTASTPVNMLRASLQQMQLNTGAFMLSYKLSISPSPYTSLWLLITIILIIVIIITTFRVLGDRTPPINCGKMPYFATLKCTLFFYVFIVRTTLLLVHCKGAWSWITAILLVKFSEPILTKLVMVVYVWDPTHTTTLVVIAQRGWSGQICDLSHFRVS